MSKQTNKLIALALVGASSFGIWKAGQAVFGESETQGTKHAVNQIWIDHLPKDDRDMITHMVLVDHRDGQFGAIGHSSQWRHLIDIFKWQLQKDTLRLYFPQERARGEVKIETWDCEGEAPAPFELCLRLTNKNGRSAMLYSRYEWEIDPKDAAASITELSEDEPALAGLIDPLREGPSLPSVDLDDVEDWAVRDALPGAR